jgi:ATP-dependent exoDNAse (exonuclease V) alpha subunit
MIGETQQDAAIRAVDAWLHDGSGAQVFRLFGWAGTGKTTIAKQIAQHVRGKVLFLAFTGKAALVLRKKGCPNAGTIHGSIYCPVEDPLTGKVSFDINENSPVRDCSLVIVDEVSMVGKDIALDLLSFGKRILVLGDPGQLPPIQGDGFFVDAEPDFMLTEIYRQAADNPIIRMSMEVREGRKLQPGRYGGSLVALRRSIDRDVMREHVLRADQLLCGKNATRHAFNERVRQIKGIRGEQEEWHPTRGDRLVCLKNRKEEGFLNGGLWNLERSTWRDFGRSFDLIMGSEDEPDSGLKQARVPVQFFKGEEAEMDWRDRKRNEEFAYGYALTVHKSQGSQFDRVMLFDESQVFGENAKKHLYTGLTRAAESIVVIQ